jgi:putative CRISPR-associated protein (TIGR02620 family)
MSTIVVTRHQALVEYLREQDVITDDIEVKTQATADDVRGKHVIGALPYHLAAEAASITVVELNIPLDIIVAISLQGMELSLEQVHEYAGNVRTYVVQMI